jgi:tetratricopeptide (TPR) repeat protein
MNRLFKLLWLLLLVGWCNTLVFAADEALLTQQAEGAGNLREALTHYVEVLKTAPLNQQLREKIINIAQKIQPPPVLTEDAKRHMARGQGAIKAAKAPEDWAEAVKEYEKVVYFAPWYADAYYNLGITRDKAGQYDDAIWALKMYLMAKPHAEDAEQAKSLIFEIEYRKEKAQKEAEKIAQEQLKPKLPTTKDLEGTWYRYTYYQGTKHTEEMHVTSSDDWLLLDKFEGGSFVSGQPYIKFRLNGHALEEGSFGFSGNRNKGSSSTYECLEQLKALGGFRSRMIQVKGRVREDWKKIIFSYRDMGSTPECTLDYYDFEVVYER